MIKIMDAYKLSRTKLRTKRLMLAISVLVSGLLFGLVFAGSLVTVGAYDSITGFSRIVSNGKYLVKSEPAVPSSVYGFAERNPSQSTVDILTSLQNEYVAKQKTNAKRLGVTFDETNFQKILIPDPYAIKTVTGSQPYIINIKSPVFPLYVNKLQTDYVKSATTKLSDLRLLAEKYGAIGYHDNINAGTYYRTLTYLKDGKEDLSKVGDNAQSATGDQSTFGVLISSVRNSMYTFVDNSLVKRFLLSAKDRKTDPSAVPVIISTDEAVEMFGAKLGIAKMPSQPADQISWMKDLQIKINGQTYAACYRNDAEINLLNQATQTAAEIASNKNNRDYAKPDLIYALPTETCGAVTLAQDKRSDVVKKAEQQANNIAKEDGTYEAPRVRLLKFQVVGIMLITPDISNVHTLSDFTASLLSAQYGVGAIIPKQTYEQIDEASRPDDVLMGYSPKYSKDPMIIAGISDHIVEFPNIAQAKAFMNQGCIFAYSCNKSFALTTYGSNYLLVYDLQKLAEQIISIALAAALSIAGIIIFVMMIRVIIDSRRETAVFRALGAKRRDIVAIYLLYSLNVALFILLFSLGLGLAVAVVIQLTYGSLLTDYAKVAYGAYSQSLRFSFIGFDWGVIAGLSLCIVLLVVLAIIPPLVRNVRRNPISDMREE